MRGCHGGPAPIEVAGTLGSRHRPGQAVLRRFIACPATEARMAPDERLASERFPRSSRYHPEWVLAGVSGGANPLWLAEWLSEALDLRPGMRVLDLGCGRALSSVFLRREFGVQVWSIYIESATTEN